MCGRVMHPSALRPSSHRPGFSTQKIDVNDTQRRRSDLTFLPTTPTIPSHLSKYNPARRGHSHSSPALRDIHQLFSLTQRRMLRTSSRLHDEKETALGRRCTRCSENRNVLIYRQPRITPANAISVILLHGSHHKFTLDLDMRSRGREFDSRPGRGWVTTLGKLFAPNCLDADTLR